MIVKRGWQESGLVLLEPEVFEPLKVVAARHEFDVAVQPGQVAGRNLAAGQGEVAKLVDGIGRLDDTVPAGDDVRVHLLAVLELALPPGQVLALVLGDVAVAQMLISSKPGSHQKSSCTPSSRIIQMSRATVEAKMRDTKAATREMLT